MSLRDGDLVICRACGRLSFYRGYQTCPHIGCYSGPLERVDPDDVETIMTAAPRFNDPPAPLKTGEAER